MHEKCKKKENVQQHTTTVFFVNACDLSSVMWLFSMSAAQFSEFGHIIESQSYVCRDVVY